MRNGCAVMCWALRFKWNRIEWVRKHWVYSSSRVSFDSPRDIEWETFWISTHCPTYSSIDINISLASQIKFGSTFVWKVFVCVSANLKLPSTRLWFNNCVALCARVRVCLCAFVMNATGDWQLFKYYLLKPARSLFCFVITLSIAHIEWKQTNQ